MRIKKHIIKKRKKGTKGKKSTFMNCVNEHSLIFIFLKVQCSVALDDDDYY